MRVWRKKPQDEASAASVARAALAGASREELVREALRALTQVPHPDRVGIWLEPDPKAPSTNELSGAFHGLVWDHTAGQDCPPEWNILALEPPLPEQLLEGGKPLEQNLDDSVSNAVIGQLVGLRRALWVPVPDPSRVKGLILLGSVSDPLTPFLERAKSLAAELALVMAAEEQLRGLRIRNAEVAFVRHFLEAPPDASSL